MKGAAEALGERTSGELRVAGGLLDEVATGDGKRGAAGHWWLVKNCCTCRVHKVTYQPQQVYSKYGRPKHLHAIGTASQQHPRWLLAVAPGCGTTCTCCLLPFVHHLPHEHRHAPHPSLQPCGLVLGYGSGWWVTAPTNNVVVSLLHSNRPFSREPHPTRWPPR